MVTDAPMQDVKDQIASLSPAKRALLELRLKQQTPSVVAEPTIRRREDRDSAPLSYAQQRFWFIDQLEPEAPSYNVPRAFRARGPQSRRPAEHALDEIVRRHETLRTQLHNRPTARPARSSPRSGQVALPIIDLSGLPEEEREAEARRLAAEDAKRPFDLKQGAPFRAGVVRLSDQEHILLLTMHHIVSDGWSAAILFRELGTLYEAFAAGGVPLLPDLPIQYADYALWQREWLQGEELERQLGYWKRHLTGAPAVSRTSHGPAAAPRTDRSGAQQSMALSNRVSDGLNELSRREGATLFMTLLAAYQALLSRYSGQDDIVIGSPIANRTRAETEGLIGFFSNTLVLAYGPLG